MATFGTWSSGDVLTAADLNAGLPACVLRDNSFVVSSGSGVQPGFGSGSEIHDPYDWHDTSTNNERITPTIAGIYLVTANVGYSPQINARVNLRIRKNTTSIGGSDEDDAGTRALTAAVMINMNGSTDYFDLTLRQDSGGPLTVDYLNFSACLIAT